MKCDARRTRPVTVLAAALGLLALAACDSGKKAATPGKAGGEVLPGSASDAMLPVDTVRSQPPLAPRPTEGARGASANATSAADDAAASEEPQAAPAEKDAGGEAAAQ